MSDTSAIEWTDATWNPTVGCTKVSAGCDHCYAETLVNRFAGSNKGFPNRFDVMTLRGEDHLTLPLRWRQPKRVFVNSLSDLFHDDVPMQFIARVFAVMALAPQHTFQLLTKRHARMRSLLADERFADLDDGLVARAVGELSDSPCVDLGRIGWPLPNVWLGVSVESQQWADIRIPALLDTPAAVRFLSCEPLLGTVDLGAWMTEPAPAAYRTLSRHYGPKGFDASGSQPERSLRLRKPQPLNWVIVGGESGPGARPMHPDWARSLRDQCVAAGVPFLFKQWGNWRPQPTYCTDDRHRVVTRDGRVCGTPWPGWGNDEPGAAVVERVGRKAAGRELDGREWNEMPGA